LRDVLHAGLGVGQDPGKIHARHLLVQVFFESALTNGSTEIRTIKRRLGVSVPGPEVRRGAAQRSMRNAAARATLAEWEAALSEIGPLPAKVSEDPATHYLPKFIAAVPAKGRVEGEIGQRIRRGRGQ